MNYGKTLESYTLWILVVVIGRDWNGMERQKKAAVPLVCGKIFF